MGYLLVFFSGTRLVFPQSVLLGRTLGGGLPVDGGPHTGLYSDISTRSKY